MPLGPNGVGAGLLSLHALHGDDDDDEEDQDHHPEHLLQHLKPNGLYRGQSGQSRPDPLSLLNHL